MKASQSLMPFCAPMSASAAFEAHKQKHPDAKGALIEAARIAARQFGGCDIHMAYGIAKRLHPRLHFSRDWLPAYAREIAAELRGEGITFKTRPSCYDA